MISLHHWPVAKSVDHTHIEYGSVAVVVTEKLVPFYFLECF